MVDAELHSCYSDTLSSGVANGRFVKHGSADLVLGHNDIVRCIHALRCRFRSVANRVSAEITCIPSLSRVPQLHSRHRKNHRRSCSHSVAVQDDQRMGVRWLHHRHSGCRSVNLLCRGNRPSHFYGCIPRSSVFVLLFLESQRSTNKPRPKILTQRCEARLRFRETWAALHLHDLLIMADVVERDVDQPLITVQRPEHSGWVFGCVALERGVRVVDDF